MNLYIDSDVWEATKAAFEDVPMSISSFTEGIFKLLLLIEDMSPEEKEGYSQRANRIIKEQMKRDEPSQTDQAQASFIAISRWMAMQAQATFGIIPTKHAKDKTPSPGGRRESDDVTSPSAEQGDE